MNTKELIEGIRTKVLSTALEGSNSAIILGNSRLKWELKNILLMVNAGEIMPFDVLPILEEIEDIEEELQEIQMSWSKTIEDL